jgi:hypothetical protein
MTLWINGLKDDVQRSIDKRVKLPENGSIDVILRVDHEPKKDVKQWAPNEPPKTSYVWDTADNRLIYASEKLTHEILSALSKHTAAFQSKNVSEVAVEIHNKGTKTKPIWFVVVKGGY